MRRNRGLRAALTILLLTTAVPAAWGQSELAELVTERRGYMFDMQTAYWALFEVNSGKSDDLAKAAEGAATINESIGKFLQLLPPGTAGGEVPGTRAKPEIWTQHDEFLATAEALRNANLAIIEAANAGDMDEFKARFETVTAACTGCHGLRPSSGGPFRYQK